MPPKQVAIPEVEPIELGAIRGVEPGELAFEIVRIEQARLELAHRREQCVCEAAEPSRAAEAVERLPREGAPDDQRLLRLGRDLPALAPATRDALEEIVEGDDRAAEEGRLNLEQLTLALFDVRPVRHDEIRLLRERVQVSAEQERHLPGIGRAGDEVQTQLTYSSRAVRRPGTPER